jgi:hypothetical protein
MGRQLTEKEVKRFGRVMAGHSQDKDRARWKRKVKGQAAGRVTPKKPARDDDDQALDDTGEDDEPR